MTTDELVKIQSEIKVLSDDFNAYYADWKGAKVRFVKLTKMFTSNVAAPSQQEIPQAEASAQPTEEHASTADDNQAAEDNVMTIRLLMTAFQPLKKLSGHPLVVRLKKMKRSGQLHQLCLKKINHIPQLLLHLFQLQSFHLHQV